MSITGGAVSAALLGYGLDVGTVWLSSSAILAFVASFAIGMGPLPFIIIGEIVPFYVRARLDKGFVY